MKRYVIYKIKASHNLVVDVQSDMLRDLSTRVVVPLIHINDAPKAGQYLNPIFTVDGSQYVFLTQFMSAVSQSELYEPIASLAEHHSEITQALDMLFHGF